jgi:hypothetical protein
MLLASGISLSMVIIACGQNNALVEDVHHGKEMRNVRDFTFTASFNCWLYSG